MATNPMPGTARPTPGTARPMLSTPRQNGQSDAHVPKLVPSHGATAAHLDGVAGALQVGEQSLVSIDTDTGEMHRDYVRIRSPGTGVIAGIGFHVVEGVVAVLAVDALSVEP